jgi:predicted enzyme related to lactoylglutathione lyase
MIDARPAGLLIWTTSDRFEMLVRFYRDTLGFPVRSERADHVSFEWDGFRITLGVHDGLVGASGDPLRMMINLEVDDIEAASRHLIAAGVEFIRSPRAEPWGGRIATFSDPDGNVVQLLELNPCIA